MSQNSITAIATVRHRYRQELVSTLLASISAARSCWRQKWSRGQVDASICQHAAVPGRHGSLCRCASPSAGKLKALGHADALADAGKVCAALLEGTEERLSRDAEAIAEAVQRPTMKFVATKRDRRSARPAGTAPGARAVGQPAAPASPSIRFAPSARWSVALRCDRGNASCAPSCRASSATPPDVLSPRMVRASSRTWLATGAGSTSGSRSSIGRDRGCCAPVMPIASG